MTVRRSSSGRSKKSPGLHPAKRTRAAKATRTQVAKTKATPAARPSRDSKPRAKDHRQAAVRLAEPGSHRRTLEDELSSQDFATRGWSRLFDLADYLCHLIDGRTTGLLATNDRKVFSRLAGLASTHKAALQWYASNQGRTPPFVAYAEKYLAKEPHGQPIPTPAPIEGLNTNLRTGPVLGRKGGKGAAGRLHSLAALKAQMVALLDPLTDADLQIHLQAYRDPAKPRPKERWVLPRALADEILSAFTMGMLSDLLREQDFRWNWEKQLPTMSDSLARHFRDEVRLETPRGTSRGRHLAKLAEQAILVAFKSIGVRVPKDLFRVRRRKQQAARGNL